MQPKLFSDVVDNINYQTDSRWEAFVNSHPARSIFHHPLWLRILEMEYGRKPLCLVHEAAGGRIDGILPLLQTKGLPFGRNSHIVGRRLSSLPRTPMAGPLVSAGVSVAPLLHVAREQASTCPGCSLEIKALSPGQAGMPEYMIQIPWRMSYILELPKDPGALRFGNSRNHARIKWAVNRALKAGVRIRTATNESDIISWYPLYLETMRTHAIPPRSLRFFRDCWNHLGKAGFMKLLLAERHTSRPPRAVAGSVFLMFGDTIYYAFNGSLKASLPLRPNDAIQWHAIHTACREGFGRFDFGEVSEGNPGLAEFKSKWGAQPSQLYRFYYPAPREASGTKFTDAIATAAYRIWRHLPLKLTERLGDWFYSYL